MALSREEIADIAKSTAQAVLEGLHRYAVAYKEPETIEQGLQDSMIEERTAADWYRKRAEHAAITPIDSKTFNLYRHIADEEDRHYDEFNARLQKLTRELEAGPSLQAVRDYWDTYLENNPLRIGAKDTDAGAFLAKMIENAGDILREYVGNRDGGYMMEKLNRIKKNLAYQRDWRDSMSPVESQRLDKTEKLLERLPVADETIRVIKYLLISICDRIIERIEFFLNQLEPLLESTKPIWS